MNRFPATLLIWLLLVLLCRPLSVFAQDTAGPADSENQVQPSAPNGAALPESPAPNQGANAPAAQLPSTPSDNTQQPAGAAAAPAPKVSGTVASRPAGSAVAPPKQRQVRSFLIKVGLVAGAGIAVGTVVALSSASPSRPPGSH